MSATRYTISHQLVFALPRARATDPQTSHEAAATVKPGNGELVRAIQAAVGGSIRSGPVTALTAFQIVAVVNLWWPNRWDEGTIRSAIARAGLTAVDTEGRSPRGSRCIRYTFGSL